MSFTLESIERVGKGCVEHHSSIVRVDDSTAWIVSHFTKNEDTKISIQEYRLLDGEWVPYNGMKWDASVVFAAADAIAEIAGGKPAATIADASIASLIIDEWTTEISKRVVPINAKRVLVVYHHGQEERKIMLREYKRASGWKIHGYLTFGEATGFEIGAHISAMRR